MPLAFSLRQRPQRHSIYSEFLDGLNYEQISQGLNADGIPTRRGNDVQVPQMILFLKGSSAEDIGFQVWRRCISNCAKVQNSLVESLAVVNLYGYRKDGGALAVSESEAEIIRRIYSPP